MAIELLKNKRKAIPDIKSTKILQLLHSDMCGAPQPMHQSQEQFTTSHSKMTILNSQEQKMGGL